MYIKDAEVLAFSNAYSRLIILGLGPNYSQEGNRLGQLILAQRVGYGGPMKFPALKKLLIRALAKIASDQNKQPELIAWQQTITGAESCAVVGLFCVDLVSLLCPASNDGA